MVVRPKVDGLALVGAETTVTVTGDRVSFANGWLGRTTEGETYPLVSAREAYDAMASGPRPAIDIQCIQAPCEAATTVIDRVELALSQQYDGDEPVLVPTWLFLTETPAFPLMHVAVDPEFLAPPTTDPGSGPAGSSSGSGSSGADPGVEPGAPEPAPMPPDPDPGAGDPPGSGSGSTGAAGPAPIERIEAPKDSTKVTVTVAAPPATGACPTQLRPSVVESADTIRVTVLLETQAPAAGTAVRCSQELREVVVRLAKPVGDRKVIDGAMVPYDVATPEAASDAPADTAPSAGSGSNSGRG